MLTQYAIEVIVKDRVREINKEIMIRQALREAFDDRRKPSPLLQRLRCRLTGLLDRIKRATRNPEGAQGFALRRAGMSREVEPCMDAG
jgi:hypothetical protein